MDTLKQFNVWNKWDPLKTVAIGCCVDPNFFEHVANIELREKLQKLVIETQEDLDNIANTCKQFGANVHRPSKEHYGVSNKLHPHKKAYSISPILHPRDHLAVLGNNLIVSSPHVITKNFFPWLVDSTLKVRNTAWYDLVVKRRVKNIHPPCWTMVGKDLFIDKTHDDMGPNYSAAWAEPVKKWARKWLPEVKVHWVDIGGHNDGCFHTLKPGVIMSLDDIMHYQDTFPGWDVLYLPDQSWSAVQDWTAMKTKNEGKYWIPGEEKNDQLINFVNTWLDEWVGYVEETVFDVNCLVINESTVLVNNYNKEVFTFLKKHKMEPIICPLRHRYFFDGGIHCVSLDLYREGECRSYIDYK